MERLFEQKDNLIKKKKQLAEEMRELEKQIDKIEQLIYKTCPHNWEERKSGGAYSTTSYLCKVCKLYKRLY